MTTNGTGPTEPTSQHGPAAGAQPTPASAPPAIIHSVAAPQGWYPDGTGPSVQRWWDGARWTDHVFDTAAATYQPPAGYYGSAPVPVDRATSPYNPFIWVVVLLPILSLVSLLAWDMTGYISATMNARAGRLGSASAIFSSLGAGYYASVGIGWLVYAVSVVFSALDYRRLGQQGFGRRFHWAWSFLGLVYIIGRTVVVRSQVGRGWLVLWVYIAVVALSVIISLVKVFSAMAAVMPSLGTGTYH